MSYFTSFSFSGVLNNAQRGRFISLQVESISEYWTPVQATMSLQEFMQSVEEISIV